MEPDRREPSRRGAEVAAVALLALVSCAALSISWFGWAVGDPGPPRAARPGDAPLISSVFSTGPLTRVEYGLNRGDGQLFAGQATDPAVRRPEMITGGPAEQAYRWERPAYGWAGWAASFGQRGAVAWALVGVTVASVTLLVAVGASSLARAGVDPRWALLVVLTPGVGADLVLVGPEALGTALALIGLVRWQDRPAGGAPGASWVVPVACFAAAGLCRETLLLVPAIVVLAELRGRRVRGAVAAATAAVPYAAWITFLRLRLGSWPEGSVGGRLSVVPFDGLLGAAAGWSPLDVAVAVAVLGSGLLGAVVARDRLVRALLCGHLVLAAALGEPVWRRVADYGRVLVPLTTLALLVLVPWVADRVRSRAERRHPGPTVVVPTGTVAVE